MADTYIEYLVKKRSTFKKGWNCGWYRGALAFRPQFWGGEAFFFSTEIRHLQQKV